MVGIDLTKLNGSIGLYLYSSKVCWLQGVDCSVISVIVQFVVYFVMMEEFNTLWVCWGLQDRYAPKQWHLNQWRLLLSLQYSLAFMYHVVLTL